MKTLIKSPPSEVPVKPHSRVPARILLVDDDHAIREMLARLLVGEGYAVLSAADGRESLELARTAEVDLVLLDLNMPGMDGWETYEKLAAENPLLPIIVITARHNQSFTAMAAGIGALLEKPLDLPKLFLTIRDLLDESEDVRLARIAGKPSEFHYVPPRADGIG